MTQFFEHYQALHHLRCSAFLLSCLAHGYSSVATAFALSKGSTMRVTKSWSILK